jgi:hypothetical protein
LVKQILAKELPELYTYYVFEKKNDGENKWVGYTLIDHSEKMKNHKTMKKYISLILAALFSVVDSNAQQDFIIHNV